MPIPIDTAATGLLGSRLDEALELVRNEFTGLDLERQYRNAFARLLKPDPLGRVLMLGTDQRDLFIPVLRSIVVDRVPAGGHLLDLGAGDGQTFSLLADAVPAGTTVSFEEPNPHYFDDIAMIRALAIAAVHHRGRDVLNNKVLADSSITHSEDGVFCALAVAYLMASLLEGESIPQAIAGALHQIPNSSWSNYIISSMIQKSAGVKETLVRYSILESSEIENIYAYPISAPETMGLLLAHLQNCSDPNELMFSGLLHKRKLDSLPALMGAVAGAHFGISWIPTEFRSDSLQLDGVSIPKLKAMTLSSLVSRLSKDS
jgi:hypothetical protein